MVGKRHAGHFIVHDPVARCHYARIPAEYTATQPAYGFDLTMVFLYAKVVTRHPAQCCGTPVRVQLRRQATATASKLI
jgi:hypothetical protein